MLGAIPPGVAAGASPRPRPRGRTSRRDNLAVTRRRARRCGRESSPDCTGTPAGGPAGPGSCRHRPACGPGRCRPAARTSDRDVARQALDGPTHPSVGIALRQRLKGCRPGRIWRRCSRRPTTSPGRHRPGHLRSNEDSTPTVQGGILVPCDRSSTGRRPRRSRRTAGPGIPLSRCRREPSP